VMTRFSKRASGSLRRLESTRSGTIDTTST
jgi:hypothetical protein